MVMSDCQSTFDYLLPCGCLRLGPSTLQGKIWTCPIGTGSAREDRSRRHAFFCCWLLLGSRYTLSLKEPMPPVMRLGVEQRRSTLTNPEQAMKIGALLHARQRDKFALFAFSGACSDCPDATPPGRGFCKPHEEPGAPLGSIRAPYSRLALMTSRACWN